MSSARKKARLKTLRLNTTNRRRKPEASPKTHQYKTCAVYNSGKNRQNKHKSPLVPRSEAANCGYLFLAEEHKRSSLWCCEQEPIGDERVLLGVANSLLFRRLHFHVLRNLSSCLKRKKRLSERCRCIPTDSPLSVEKEGFVYWLRVHCFFDVSLSGFEVDVKFYDCEVL